jgi:hypothetical protein
VWSPCQQPLSPSTRSSAPTRQSPRGRVPSRRQSYRTHRGSAGRGLSLPSPSGDPDLLTVASPLSRLATLELARVRLPANNCHRTPLLSRSRPDAPITPQNTNLDLPATQCWSPLVKDVKFKNLMILDVPPLPGAPSCESALADKVMRNHSTPYPALRSRSRFSILTITPTGFQERTNFRAWPTVAVADERPL